MPITIASGWLIVLYLATAALTGLLLNWHYLPTTAHAHTCVVDLQSGAAGRFLRSSHFFSSHFALGLCVLHLVSALILRPVEAEATFETRRWLSGLVGCAILVALGFSGRVLPWDDHGGVSLLVAEGFFRLGDLSPVATILGPEQTGHQLQRLLLLHAGGIAALAVCGAWHIDLRDRLAALMRASTLTRVVIISVAGVGLLAVVAALVPAPLGPPFVDGPSAHVGAEWYLRWVQTLSLRSALAAQAVVVTIVGLGLVTPVLARRLGERALRFVWLVVLAGLAAASFFSR